MPQVPIYQQQIQPTTAAPTQTQFNSNATPEAFGVGANAAGAQLGQSISKVGDLAFQRSLEHQQDYNKSVVIEADTRFRNLTQDALYSTELDANGVPKGYLNRTQKQALGSTGDYDKDMYDKMHEFLGKLENPDQQQAFLKNSMASIQAVRGNVIAHEAKQKDDWDWANIKSNNAQRVADASLYAQNPKAFNEFLADSKSKYADSLRTKGADDAAIGFETQQHASDITKSAVNSLLDTNPRKAQDILNSAKGSMSENNVADIQRTIDGKLFYDKVQSNVSRSVQYMNPDGITYDLAKVHDDIYAQAGTFEDKAKQFSEVSTRLKGMENDTKRTEAANVLKMSNDGITAGSYDKAMKLVPQAEYGLNPVKQQEMQDFFKKVFTEKDPPTNPVIYNKLADGIRAGNYPSSKQIDDLYKSKQISLTDRSHFMELVSKQNDKEQKTNFDSSHDAVKVFADDKFPNSENKLEKEKFMYQLNSEALRLKITDPVQLRKLGDDLFKSKSIAVPRVGLGWLAGYVGAISPTKNVEKPRFELDYDSQREQDLGKAKYGSLVGNDMAQNMGVTRLDQLVKDIGPDQFSVGSPAHNAVQSLMSANYRPEKINTDNVKAILKKYPTGVVPQNVINKWRSGK